MHNTTEYSIPVTIKEKAQIIPIKKNVRIDNDKIQSFIETLIRRKRIASLLYVLFVVISILSIIYTVCFHGFEQRYGAFVLFLIFIGDLSLITAALYIDKKWSADRLHIKPIQKYEFTDNDSKVLCTTSRYDFEKNDTETELFPNKYVRFDLENKKVPFLEAYTYRTSPKYWITIHLTKEAKNKD